MICFPDYPDTNHASDQMASLLLNRNIIASHCLQANAHPLDVLHHPSTILLLLNIYQDGGHEGSSVGRWKKTKTSKEEREGGHVEDLNSTTHTHRQQHHSSWGSENITMNQWPPKIKFFLQHTFLHDKRERKRNSRKRERERERERERWSQQMIQSSEITYMYVAWNDGTLTRLGLAELCKVAMKIALEHLPKQD